MRALAAVALCLLVGACATSDRGGPNIYGIYDVVSANGQDWPTADGMSGWYELRADGTSTLTMTIPSQPDLEPANADFSVGEMEDGCVPFNSTGEDGSQWTGTICGDEFKVEGPETSVVMRRRR
jgi:hypothetical protein